MPDIQTSTAPARGDDSTKIGAGTFAALEASAQNKIRLLDQRIKNYLQNQNLETGTIDAFFGTSDAQLAMASSDHKQIKAMQEQRLALTRSLEEAQELNKSGKTTEAKTLVTTALKNDKQNNKNNLSAAANEARKIDQQISQSQDRIDTAITITQTVKDTAIVAAATVATVGTAGLGASLGAGLVAGTGIGVLANSGEAAVHVAAGTKSTEQAILDACEQTKQHAVDSFKATVTSAMGAGVATKVAGKMSKAAGTAAKSYSSATTATAKAATQGAVSAAANSGYDLNAKYQQAREDFNKQYADQIKNGNEKELSETRDKFFKDRGLDLQTMATHFAIDTSAGAVSGLIGGRVALKADQVMPGASSNLVRGAALVSADTTTGVVIGLGSAAAKGELNKDSLAREISSNVVSSLAGTSSHHAQSKNLSAHIGRSTKAERTIKPPAAINDFAPTAAKPRIEISADPNLPASEAQTVTRTGETRPSETTIKLKSSDDLHHEILHSTQAGIDPGTTASGKIMPQDEYIARRALQELEAKPTKDQAHAEIKSLLDAATKANPEEATKHLKAAADLGALSLSTADLKQYHEDYQTNLNRKAGEPVRQKSFTAKTPAIKPEEHEAVKEVLTIGEDLPMKIRHRYDDLNRAIDILLKRDGKSSEVARYRDFRDAVINLGCSSKASFVQDTPEAQIPTRIQELNSHQTALTNLIKRIEDADNHVRKKTKNKVTLEEVRRSDKANNYQNMLTALRSKNDALNLEIARLSALNRPIHPEKRRVDNAIATEITDPALRAAATAVEARGNQDYHIPVKGNVNRGKWTIEALKDKFEKNFNGLSMPEEGRYGKGDFSEKRVEVVLEKLKQAGTINGYAMSGNDTFYDHMGVDAWVGIGGAHIPLQIKSSEKLLNEHYNTKGHKRNSVGIYTADKSLISDLEPELQASMRSTTITPFTMLDDTVFNPFNPVHTRELRNSNELQQKFLDHFVETAAPKYKGHQENIGSYTGFDLMVY